MTVLPKSGPSPAGLNLAHADNESITQNPSAINTGYAASSSTSEYFQDSDRPTPINAA